MNTSPALPPDAAAFGISFDGRAYHYQRYGYDQLADALGYAKLDRARHGCHEQPAPQQWRQWTGPTPEERQQMAAHGIGYERGHYCYGPYHYDLLAAALDYARHEPGLAPAEPHVQKEAGKQ